MFSKLFKKSEKNVTKSNMEKLNSSELKNVIGGGNGDTVPLPVDAAKVRSHSNQNNN